jgi:TrmH family RNA methyltransferase
VNFEYISSRNNQLVKWVASLSEKKYRQRSNAFIAEGVKLTLEALSSGLVVTHIFVSEENSDDILGVLNDAINSYSGETPKVCVLTSTAFDKITTEKAPQGVI